MILKILLTGDVNLMNVTNPADPFAMVATEFKSADLVFSNLECCFYEPDAAHALDREGFFAPLASAEALKIAGIDAVGIANNVNYGTAPNLVVDRAVGSTWHSSYGRRRHSAKSTRTGCA